LASLDKAERPTEEWVFSLFDYRDKRVKEAIWHLKYKNRKKMAKTLARALYEHIVEELLELKTFGNFRDPLVIPIPLSRKRYFERGYNQAKLIAKEVCKLSAGELKLAHRALIKHKETEHQAHIKEREKRLLNLRDSFSVPKKERVSDRNIILIDDVTTTGATLEEAKRILKESGAKKVIAFTVAH
jgi:ComF family protein